jgi:hypothetical protein
MVFDIHRPDVNGAPPKMQSLVALFSNPDLEKIPYYRVRTDDNILSSIIIFGSFDPAESWVNKIYENSRYFRFTVYSEKGKRYYTEGESVRIELLTFGHKLKTFEGFKKFRKYTGAPEQCADKLKKWLIATAELVNS